MATIFDFEFFYYLKEYFGQATETNNHDTIYVVLRFIALAIIFFTIIRTIYKKILPIIKNRKWRKKQLDEILRDYGNYTTLQQRWLYLKTWFQINPPNNLAEPYDSQSRYLRTSSIDFFINDVFKKDNDNPPFYCILGGSGMGKSTFVVHLVRSYYKKHTDNTLPYPIKLFYCGELIEGNNTLLNRIEKIENKGNTILILDALDENNEAIDNYSEFYNELLAKITLFPIVVITCRTQFFEKYEDEPNKLPIHEPNTKRQLEFEKYYISPLNDKEVTHYLNKKYPLPFSSKRKKAKSIVDNCKKLMARPLLLSYLDDLLKSDIENRKASIAQIYDILINKWLEREASFVVYDNKEEYKKTLLEFSTDLAICMAQPSYRKEEIDDIIGRYKDKRIIKEQNLKGRSLLNRNSKNDFKFAHKSFMEFLVAREIAEVNDIPQKPIEAVDCISNEMIQKFLSYIIDLRVPRNPSHDLHFFDSFLLKPKETNSTDIKVVNIYIECDFSKNNVKYLSAFLFNSYIKNLHIDCRYNSNANLFNYSLQDAIPIGEKFCLPKLYFHNYNFRHENLVLFLEKLTPFYSSFTISLEDNQSYESIIEGDSMIIDRLCMLDSTVWILTPSRDLTTLKFYLSTHGNPFDD